MRNVHTGFYRSFKTILFIALCICSGRSVAQSLPDTGALVKIPVDSTRWYILDNVSNGLGALTDSVTDVNVNVGYGLLINNFDAFYPIKPGEQIDLYRIKFFSYEGSLDSPMTISVIDSTGTRTLIGTFLWRRVPHMDGALSRRYYL